MDKPEETVSSEEHRPESVTVPRKQKTYKSQVEYNKMPARYGFMTAVLLVAVVAAAYWGYNISYNSNNSTSVTAAWGVILTITTVLVGLLVGLGLPWIWSKGKGFKQMLHILLFVAVFLVIGLVVSAFFLFPSSDSCNNPNSACYGSNTNSTQTNL